MDMNQLNDGSDIVAKVRQNLAAGATGDDEARLRTLEELYRTLESELEGDLDQAGSSRF